MAKVIVVVTIMAKAVVVTMAARVVVVTMLAKTGLVLFFTTISLVCLLIHRLAYLRNLTCLYLFGDK